MIGIALVVCVALVCVTVIVLQRGYVPPIEIAAPLVDVVEERMRERVLVTLVTGEAFAGVLWEADARAWVLRDAVAVGAANDSTNVSVDGEVVLPAANIAFAQRP